MDPNHWELLYVITLGPAVPRPVCLSSESISLCVFLSKGVFVCVYVWMCESVGL